MAATGYSGLTIAISYSEVDHPRLPLRKRDDLLEGGSARESGTWTDDVVDFVFWVLIRNYYNTLQDYGKIWRDWGLRDAVVQREPRVLARHLVSVLSEIIRRDDDPGRYGPWGLAKLAAEVPQPPEPWAAAFFGELERIFAERAGERADKA